MSYNELKSLANQKGVGFTDMGGGHIQLRGSLLVNYYPDSKKKTAYVAGTKKPKFGVTLEHAIDMCFLAPESQGVIDKRSNNARRKRQRLIKKGVNKCRWCKKPLTIDDSTLEHVIPLARGGLDNANNWDLACEKCNSKRGHDMPELSANTNN
ncbi:MAG: HNH endonuclease [Gammaproteobacteria bacterium]|nr:HNH endonuclease [Gammaproteobacteria bacterium]